MKVFLSGKMNDQHGSWRDVLLGKEWHRGESTQKWVIHRNADWDRPPEGRIESWPTLPSAVLGLYDYVGPYRQEIDDYQKPAGLGYVHGVTAEGQHGMFDNGEQAIVHERCLAAIRHADIVFAFINTPDCFGSLVEIGYAAAYGKTVGLLVHPDACWERSWDQEDYWFAAATAATSTYWAFEDDGTFPGRPSSDLASHINKAFSSTVMAYVSVAEKRAASRQQPSFLDELRGSYSQIARWTSDPRVRGEAQRMLRTLDIKFPKSTANS